MKWCKLEQLQSNSEKSRTTAIIQLKQPDFLLEQDSDRYGMQCD